MEDLIEAVIEIRLQPAPYAFECMVGMVNAWGLRLLQSDTRSTKAKIGMPSKEFKIRFGVNPRIGDVPIPEKVLAEMSGFIKKMKVIEIRVKQSKQSKQSKKGKK